MAKPMTIEIHVVVYFDEDTFVAHCLEMDLVGCGKTKREAVRELDGNVKMQLESASEYGLSALYNPAPVEFWRLYQQIESEAQRCASKRSVSSRRIRLPLESIADRTECAELL